jgi:rare lipoprotein A
MPAPTLARPRRSAWAVLAAAALVLAGCSSGPPRTPARDGPEANPPAHLDRVPDAEPRLEPLRVGGPNKPYEVLGERYVPMTADQPWRESGLASWYGRKFHGRPTSLGETYDMYAMTAAHKTLPLPSYARIRNPANGREIVVRINDRGPFHSDRIVDLSYTAALKLGVLGGVAPVVLERITFDEIRSGLWRRERDRATPLPPPPPPATDDPLRDFLDKRGDLTDPR